MTQELHRPLAVERVGDAGLDFVVEATEGECAALARRMKLPAVLSLTCRFHLARDLAGSLEAHAQLVARVVQVCVVSLEEFATEVAEDFTVRFVPAASESDDDDPEAPDEIPYSGGVIDLGEAAAEQLALALDPYPRAPGAELPEIETEAAPHAFEALKRRH